MQRIRRRTHRAMLVRSGTLQLEDGRRVDATAIDLSVGGALFYAQADLTPGERVLVELDDDESSFRLKARATVLRRSEVNPRRRAYAVEFCDLDEFTRRGLSTFIADLELRRARAAFRDVAENL